MVVGCYPSGLKKTTLPDQLLTNRTGFASEKKAIVDCINAGQLTDQLAELLRDPSTGLPTPQRVRMVVGCYPSGLKKTTLPDQLLINRTGFVGEKKAIIDCVKKL
jgi:hypothetical protein